MGAGSSGEGGMDAANLLKPMLARGQLHCIGATTLAEYRNAIVSAATLAARYLTQRRLPDSAVDLIDEAAAAVRVARESQPEILDQMERKIRQLEIEIHALDREKDEASKIRLGEAKAEKANLEEDLRPLQERYESEKDRTKEIQEQKVKLDQLKVKQQEAERTRDLQTASDLKYYAIPDVEHRINELEQQKADADLEHKHTADGEPLMADAVGPDRSRRSLVDGLVYQSTRPEGLLRRISSCKWKKFLVNLWLAKRKQVTSVANAIRLQRSGLANPNQPPSSYSVGPSGTGKTLLTKALAEFLFDDPKSMIRFDMSEYQERHSLSRMIGAPPGLCCKGVLTVLLQLMDDWSYHRRTRKDKSMPRIVLLFMTSNLGAEYLARPNAPERRIDPTTRELVMTALRNYFLPEFLNRISSIVIFNRLTKREIRKIVDVRLEEIQKRLISNGRNVKIDCDNEVKDYLVLILRGAIKDGEIAKVVLEDGHVQVLPTHGESDEDDQQMWDDEDDAAAELNGDGGGYGSV
ncbi:hypothetical protein MRB53_040016 [Persea americana]|nr:hypothetical protein MRB53_040016 [Persea americana]